MAPPLEATGTAYLGTQPLLAGYLFLIAIAAFAGGVSVSFLTLGHRRLQVFLSFTGGVLLGVGLLHMIPHAFLELDNRIDQTMNWVLLGFFVMFLLERAFHGHSHHAADGCESTTTCLHDTTEHDQFQGHAPDPARHAHNPSQLGWSGAFIGLGLHSLADGAALAAAVHSDIGHGVTWLAGLATFLAIALHKPFDAGIISTLMLGSGIPRNTRLALNFLYALAVPAGAFFFVLGINFLGDSQSSLTGASLGLAAGAFLCIAAADLLPEVQFHSHDRILLTVALAAGIELAWVTTALEQTSHSHNQIVVKMTENSL
jgi:zinc and cadmium transporter